MLARVDYNKNYIYIKYPETVNAKTLYGMLESLKNIDFSADNVAHRLHDFRLTSRNLVDRPLISTIISQGLAGQDWQSIKSALVITNKLQFEMARNFDYLMENTGMRVAIFNTLDKAVEYLTC